VTCLLRLVVTLRAGMLGFAGAAESREDAREAGPTPWKGEGGAGAADCFPAAYAGPAGRLGAAVWLDMAGSQGGRKFGQIAFRNSPAMSAAPETQRRRDCQAERGRGRACANSGIGAAEAQSGRRQLNRQSSRSGRILFPGTGEIAGAVTEGFRIIAAGGAPEADASCAMPGKEGRPPLRGVAFGCALP